MNDSGLWKRGVALLVLVGIIAGVALFVILRRPGSSPAEEPQPCPDLLAASLYAPASAALAPFPATIQWGFLHQVAQTSPSAQGWQIRYNATLALARKGVAVPPFDNLLEMLDERQQRLNFSVCGKDGRLMANEAEAMRTVFDTLEAIAEWYRHPDRLEKFGAVNADLRQKYDAGFDRLTRAVEQLTQSSNQALRTEAIKTLQVLRPS